MMKRFLSLLLATALMLGLIPATALGAEPNDVGGTHYRYADIAGRLLDTEFVARLPQAGEKSAAFTSYDTRSYYDEASDTYVNWGANGDGGGPLDEHVPGKGNRALVLDLNDGPGVVWRIWSATAGPGLIEVYIDGEEEPTIAKPYFQLMTVHDPDGMFNYPGLNYIAGQGYNCYVPITFNESCKIYLYEDWGAYYQFTYSLLADGDTVERMPAGFSAADRAALEEVDDFFCNRLGENPNSLDGAVTAANDYTVPAGSAVTVLDHSGEGALAQFRVRIDDEDGAMEYNRMWTMLKELTVSMYWDGESTPSVWSPLGDFFGVPAGPAAYTSLTLGLDADGWLYCYFYMPFADGARIVLGNDGDEDIAVTVDTAIVPLKADIGAYARFHAKWNKDAYQPERADRWPDYTVLMTEGAGRFLGMSLHVYKDGYTRDPNAGEGDWWWGEGDEKFFVDGEKFPSTFGTGTEDYFGYAWCSQQLFKDRAFHAQNYSTGGDFGKGNKANMRIQLVDNTPFLESFEATLEKYYRHDTEYGVVAYWYLSAGGVDGYGPVEPAVRNFHVMDDEPLYNWWEAEALSWTVNGSGVPYVQSMVGFSDWGWGEGRSQVLWPDNAVGDSIEFTFQARRELEGILKVSLTKSSDFGQFQFYLDGEPVGDVIETYNPVVTNNGGINLGMVSVDRGTHTLRAEVVGRNERASGTLLGLDSFTIDPELPVPGVIEGEDLEVLEVTGGNTPIQNMAKDFPALTYSRGKSLWWTTAHNLGTLSRDQRQGDTLTLALDLDEAVDSEMVMYFTQAGNYAIVQLYLNGEALGEPVDLYNSAVIRSDAVSFGRVQLEPGRHELMLEIVGRNSRSVGYMSAIDCIVFTDIEDDEVRIDTLDAENGALHLTLTGVPDEEPVLEDFQATIEGEELALTAMEAEADRVTLYFEAIEQTDEEQTFALSVRYRDTAAVDVTLTVEALDEVIPVESVSIDRSALSSMRKNETIRLTATVLPENATDAEVVWSSSNENVLIVEEDGTVTAVKVGSAIITATAGGQRKMITIRVSA